MHGNHQPDVRPVGSTLKGGAWAHARGALFRLRTVDVLFVVMCDTCTRDRFTTDGHSQLPCPLRKRQRCIVSAHCLMSAGTGKSSTVLTSISRTHASVQIRRKCSVRASRLLRDRKKGSKPALYVLTHATILVYFPLFDQGTAGSTALLGRGARRDRCRAPLWHLDDDLQRTLAPRRALCSPLHTSGTKTRNTFKNSSLHMAPSCPRPTLSPYSFLAAIKYHFVCINQRVQRTLRLMGETADTAGTLEQLGAPAGAAVPASNRLMREQPWAVIAAPVWLCSARPRSLPQMTGRSGQHDAKQRPYEIFEKKKKNQSPPARAGQPVGHEDAQRRSSGERAQSDCINRVPGALHCPRLLCPSIEQNTSITICYTLYLL